jgi:hypothetical protein
MTHTDSPFFTSAAWGRSLNHPGPFQFLYHPPTTPPIMILDRLYASVVQ